MMENSVVTDNGISVYSYPQDHLHTFNISLYIKSGILYESENRNGISHLFEHIVFKNTNRSFNDRLYMLLDQNCLTYDACTYKEFILFQISGMASKFRCAADIICSVFDEIELPNDAIAIEKKRIKAEILEDVNPSSVDRVFQQNVWMDSPLSRTIPGSCSVLDKISKKMLNDFRSESLSGGNCFFYLTGKVGSDDVSYLKNRIEEKNILSSSVIRDNSFQMTDHLFNRSGEAIVKTADYCYVKLGFDIDNEYCSKPVRDILYSRLFAGECSLIFQKLSEKSGLIYSFDARLEEYVNVSNISFEYGVRHNNLEKSIVEAVSILNNLKRQCDLLQITKDNLSIGTDIMSDNQSDLNWTMGYECHILGRRFRSLDERKAEYESVNDFDLCEAASRIFRTCNITAVIKGKKKDAISINRELQKLDT